MTTIGTGPKRGPALSALLVGAALGITGCQSGSSTHGGGVMAVLDTAPPFLSRVYGVPASPRVTSLVRVRKGGGRSQVGKPYKVRGKWYYPKEEPGYVRSGKASWYGSNFHGRLTANGEVYDMYGLSAAHPTFPLPSYARVTNLENGNEIVVRVNDRGPYAEGRVVDVSSRAAEFLDFKEQGVADVKVEYIGRAPVEGDDTEMLMATFRPGDGGYEEQESVMVAMADIPDQRATVPSSLAGSDRAELPGVRPLSTIGETGDNGPAVLQPDLSGLAPIPSARSAVVSSYAPANAAGAALDALDALSTRPGGERIEIGLVEDAELLERIRTVVLGQGRLLEEAVADGPAGGLSLEVEVAVEDGVDTDGLLQRLWRVGADGAFVIRD